MINLIVSLIYLLLILTIKILKRVGLKI